MLDLETIFDPDRPVADCRLARELNILPDPPPGIGPENLPLDWRDMWAERVSIMQVDGRVPLEHAEAKALALILAEMKRAGVSLSEDPYF